MKATIHIKGMHCAGCEKRIEKVLLSISNITNVQANYNDGIVTIIYDEALDKEHICTTLNTLGFEVLEVTL